jgi:dimethylargininase
MICEGNEMTFTKAIVRTPGRSLVNGLTAANLGKPQYEKALSQHASYVQALESAGLDVTVLMPDEQYPDSTFVEDTALLTSQCAIITRPGAPSRRGETEAIERALEESYSSIDRVRPPGKMDAGDIMMVGTHFYIGLSQRTNKEGADQVIRILKRYGMTGSTIPLAKVLHLKSGVSYLEHNRLVAAGEFVGLLDFASCEIIKVDEDEQYAANCLWLNGIVLTASGFPKITFAIEAHGYKTVQLDMSEFQKLDGGLSCLSLRF